MRKTILPTLLVVTAMLLACINAYAQCAVTGSPGCCAAFPDNTLTPAEKAGGYKLLFDGKTLDGWTVNGDPKNWEIKDGVIEKVPGEGKGYLHTQEKYGNFILKIDFKVGEKSNSGVFFRVGNMADIVNTGIEMQILDSASKQTPGKNDSGAIYDCLAPSENAMKPAGEWNSAVIRCKDNFITVYINGKTVIRMNLDQWTEAGKNPDGTTNKFRTAYKDMPRVGHIALQNHGNTVYFKNIKILASK